MNLLLAVLERLRLLLLDNLCALVACVESRRVFVQVDLTRGKRGFVKRLFDRDSF